MSFAFQLAVSQGAGAPTRAVAAFLRACAPARWVRLLVCQLLACFCLWLGAGSAWAAPSLGSAADPAAPMCDPDGASVAAGEDIPEVDRGRFEALPCEAQLLMAGWRPDAPEFGEKALHFDDRESQPPRPPEAPRSRYEGAREFSVPFPARAAPVLTARDDGEGLAPNRGHARSLFRPPVAHA
jgi:hypothetical protein